MCCNNWNRCCRCCGCRSSQNSGNTNSLFSNLSISMESGNGTGLPVYLTIPAYLWGNTQDEDDNSCGCGCRCC